MVVHEAKEAETEAATKNKRMVGPNGLELEESTRPIRQLRYAQLLRAGLTPSRVPKSRAKRGASGVRERQVCMVGPNGLEPSTSSVSTYPGSER